MRGSGKRQRGIWLPGIRWRGIRLRGTLLRGALPRGALRRRVLPSWGLLLCGLLFASPARLEAQNRWLTGAMGGAAGMAAGGYISLTIVVAEARAGRYLMGLDDFLSWRSAPVLLGGGVGAAVGYLDPDRLKRIVIGGSAAGLAGMGVGMLLGPRIWDDPEARWAGGAIGLGAGLALGSAVGLVWPPPKQGTSQATPAAAVPVAITLRF